MARYIMQRIIYMFITFFTVMTITFVFMQMLPGSPFKNEDKLSPQQIDILREHYHLNDPVIVQYYHYVVDLLQGDLGMSFQYTNQEVTKLILERLPVSAVLGLESLLIGILLGVLLGIITGLKHGTMWDSGVTIFTILGVSIPSFVFAGFMQYFFAVKLGWLPAAYWEGWQYHIMPAFSLAIFKIAKTTRFIRMGMLDVLSEDYMKTATAKGLPYRTVVVKHGLKNTLVPVITILGPMVLSILTGSLVIEKIFVIPGIGDLFVSAIMANDYPVIMALTLFYAALFIVLIFIIDMLYGIIDPRIKLGRDNK